MHQRLGIAAAAVGGPDLLLLDEPSSGLDLIHREELGSLLERVGEVTPTVVLTTHLPEDVADICDFAVFLQGGTARGEWRSGSGNMVRSYRDCVLGNSDE